MRDGAGIFPGFEQQLAQAALGRDILRKLAVDGDGFGRLLVFLVEIGQLQERIAIVRVELGRLAEMRRRLGQLALSRQRVGRAKLRSGRLGIQLQRQAVVLFGFGRRSGLKLRFGKVVAGTELTGLLLRCVLKQRQSLGGVPLAHQQNPLVQLGFIQTGLQIERLTVFRDAFRILTQQAVGHGQVEMREVIPGVGFDGFGKGLNGGFVLPILEGLHPRGTEIGGLEEEQRRRNGPHT